MRLTIRNSDGTVSQPMNLDWAAALDKLAAYEDAEEQGLLVRLPCKVGDTAYRIVRHRVDVSGYRMEWEWETAVEAVKFRIGMTDLVGKTVFLTRAEAENALRKGGGET